MPDIRPSASRQIGAHSNGSGSEGGRAARSAPASGGQAAVQRADRDAQRSSAPLPAGKGMVAKPPGSAMVASPVSIPTVAADIPMSPAQPDLSSASAPAANGRHAAGPPPVSAARPKEGMQRLGQAADIAAGHLTASQTSDSALRPAAVQAVAVAAASQSSRSAALRLAASGASCLSMPPHMCCRAAAKTAQQLELLTAPCAGAQVRSLSATGAVSKGHCPCSRRTSSCWTRPPSHPCSRAR